MQKVGLYSDPQVNSMQKQAEFVSLTWSTTSITIVHGWISGRLAAYFLAFTNKCQAAAAQVAQGAR
jgi:hypothetical protein